jgi:hypothetical protein
VRRPAIRHLLLSAQAWWDAQRFDQSVWQVMYCAETLWHVVIAFSRASANLAAYIHLLWSRQNVLHSWHLGTIPRASIPPGHGHKERLHGPLGRRCRTLGRSSRANEHRGRAGAPPLLRCAPWQRRPQQPPDRQAAAGQRLGTAGAQSGNAHTPGSRRRKKTKKPRPGVVCFLARGGLIRVRRLCGQGEPTRSTMRRPEKLSQ